MGRPFIMLLWYHYDISKDHVLIMPNLLVRNLDEDVLKRLKASARVNRRSLQAELHEILQRASRRNLAETRRLSAQWLKRLRDTMQSDSADLVREDRIR